MIAILFKICYRSKRRRSTRPRTNTNGDAHAGNKGGDAGKRMGGGGEGENPKMVLLYDDLTNNLDENFTDKNNEIYLYSKSFYFKTFKEIDLLRSDINAIENTIQKIKSIESIQYIFQQISDTLNDGIKNIENIENIQGIESTKRSTY